MIKLSIPFKADSYNSYPSDSLEVEIHDETVTIQYSDDDREVSINRNDFLILLKVMEDKR